MKKLIGILVGIVLISFSAYLEGFARGQENAI